MERGHWRHGMDTEGRRWSVLFALWLLQVGGVAYTIAPAGALTVVQSALGVGPTGANWLISAVYLGMFSTAIPAGVATERLSIRGGIGGGTLLLVAVMVGSWLAGTAYWPLLVLRFVVGALVVAVFTLSVPTIGALFPREQEATAVGVYSTSVPAGIALGQFGGSFIVTRAAWNDAFLVFGLLELAGLAVFLRAIRGVSFEADGRERPTGPEVYDVLSRRSVWGVAVLAFLAFALNLLFANWMPTYITTQFDVSIAVGGLLAATFPAVGIFGRVSSGPISERWFAGGRRPVVFRSFLAVTPLVALFPVVDTVLLLVVALLVAGFVSQIGLALLYTYVRELVPGNVERSALAVLNAVGFFGAFVAPLATGELVERTGSYLPLFAFGTALAVARVGVAWLLPDAARPG